MLRPMGMYTVMCHCIINVCKKTGNICMSFRFSRVYVWVSSGEAEKRLAGRRPLPK